MNSTQGDAPPNPMKKFVTRKRGPSITWENPSVWVDEIVRGHDEARAKRILERLCYLVAKVTDQDNPFDGERQDYSWRRHDLRNRKPDPGPWFYRFSVGWFIPWEAASKTRERA